jgi:hypothetical protein
VDAQDNLARLFNEGEYAEVRADPAASDGLAVWMPGSHHEWAFQLPIERLPARARSGKWQVYVVARAEAEGASPDRATAAFTAGVYDGGARVNRAERSVSLGEAGAGYRSYLLGTVDLNAGQYLWVAPTANTNVRAVWVDRVYFVPAK